MTASVAEPKRFVKTLTTRELPPEEWSRLDGTELGASWHQLQPTWARVLVVEDGDQIVGCWALMNLWHLEGLWLAPEWQHRPSVARRLWVGMRRLMASVGAQSAITASVTPNVQALLEKRAVALPVNWYVMQMGDTRCR